MLVQTKRKQNAATGTRVKVAVRCRPPFQDEIDFAKGDFFSIVDTKEEDAAKSTLGRISLTMISGKQRDFYFDYVFGETTAQDQVYDRLARPVVADVLKGCNGTIFAYGQTGTGKTYTMGILEFVRNEHAGLIPRAIAQIFDYVDGNEGRIDMTISLSFLQLYRESIQDLLSQASGNNSPSEDNLLIREDPIKGFYVEGLQEFVVRSYLEAEALINLGLENRAIAPTMMNSTSSRSHTVLTINIEQRVQGDSQNYTKTLRSKLLMVDLAGSERVRRTVSKGTRLSEAKSINTSLSALGNVIAALAESNSAHIPYRDSKLTRLLQDSLGGTAATALIATIGPAAINYGETLSTLLFAQRCMAVKVTPIPHEEVDYAEMCAKLQAQINDLQGSMSEKLIEQQTQYEKTIEDLQNQLDDERAKTQQSALVSSMVIPATGISSEVQQGLFQNELRMVLETVERLREQDPEVTARIEHSWFMKPNDWSAMEHDYDRFPNGPLVSVLAFNYEILRSLYLQIRQVLRENQQRDDIARGEMAQLLATEATLQQERVWEKAHMALEDPRFVEAQRQGQGKLDPIGSHLTPIQRCEALKKVDAQFRSNSLPVSKYDQLPVHVGGGGGGSGDGGEDDGEPPDPVIQLLQQRPTMFQYDNLDHFLESVAWLHQALTQDLVAINVLFARKDWHFKSLKEELTTQIVDRRKREEEVVNWSYILKYLLKSASKLRRELQAEKRANAHPHLYPSTAPAGHRTPGMLPPPSSSNSSITSADSSSRPDTLATPDTANFLANFLHHNPPSADSRLTMSSVSGFTAGFSPTNERGQHLGEDAYSEVSDSVATSGRDRASTVSSGGGNGQGNSGSVEPSPRERSKSSGSAGTATSNAVSSGRTTGGGARGGGGGGGGGGGVVHFDTAEEQHAYDDALQRVQLRAKPNATTSAAHPSAASAAPRGAVYATHMGRATAADNDDEEDDLDSDYSSLPSTSSRSYRSAASSSMPLPPRAASATATTAGGGASAPANRAAATTATGHGGDPILQSSTVVTGKDGRPVIVTSPPNTKGHLGGPSGRGRQQQQQPHASLEASTSSAASTSSSSMVDFQPIDISSRHRGGGAGGGGGGGGPSMAGGHNGNTTDQHAVGKALAKNRAKKEMAQGPSAFAQEVAKSLGVQGQQARDAMAIIDQIASISSDQLAQLDAATRQEIQQLRQELGIDKFLRQQQQQQTQQKTTTLSTNNNNNNNNGSSSQLDDDQWHQRASLAEQQHIERARSFSGASSMASSTAPSTTPRSGSVSRSSSRGRGASSSSATGPTTIPPSPPRGDQPMSQSSSRSSSRSRGLMNTTTGTAAANGSSFITQAEIRPASVGRNGGSGGGSGGSRSNTPSQRSTASTLTANSHNNQSYLRQHSLRNTGASQQPPPGELFVDLAAMATSSNANANTNNNGGRRYHHAPPSTTPSTARSSSGGAGGAGGSQPHHKYGYDDYDDDGYYSGVADSSISSRNSSYFMPPPPPPPPRPANLNQPPPTMSGGGRGYAAQPAGYASSASSQNSNSRYGHGHGHGRSSGQQRPSASRVPVTDDDDDDNDDEFSQLDSMG